MSEGSRGGFPDPFADAAVIGSVQFGLLLPVLLVGGVAAVQRARKVEGEVVVVGEPKSAGKD